MKIIIWGGKANNKGIGAVFYGEGGRWFSRNNAILKFYCKSYWILYKILYDASFPYITVVLPVLYKLARPKKQVKVHQSL